MNPNDMNTSPIIMEADEAEKQRRLFVLGLMVLGGWMAIIVLCAYPQLFRDLLLKYVFCCFAKFASRRREKCRQRMEKVKHAQERVRSASRSFLTVSMAAKPSDILLNQVGMGESLTEVGSLRKQKFTKIFIPELIPELDLESASPSRAGTIGEEEEGKEMMEASQNQPANC